MQPRNNRQIEELISNLLNAAEIDGLTTTPESVRSLDTALIERHSASLPWEQKGKIKRWLAWREFERRQALLAKVDIQLYSDFEQVFDELVEEKFEVDARWEDHGIGPYEYGSERGVHHDWGIEPRVLGPDTLLIEACVDDYAPPEEENTTHSFSVYVPPRSRRDTEHTAEVVLSFRLEHLTMRRETVEVEGEHLSFWRLQAELSAGEVSVS